MPTSKELDTLHVYWLADAAPWDPTTISESLDDTMPAPLSYSHDLGEMELLDLILDLFDRGRSIHLPLMKTSELNNPFTQGSRRLLTCTTNIPE